MLNTEVIEVNADSKLILALCTKCNHQWKFSLAHGAKTSSKRCPGCKVSQRFKVVGDAGDLPYTSRDPQRKDDPEHQKIDKDQEAALAKIFSSDTFHDEEKSKSDLGKKIENMFPQSMMFSALIESYLSQRLPADRAAFYAKSLGTNADLLCQKYGLSNVMGTYGLEISTALICYSLVQEISKIEEAKTPKKGKKIDIKDSLEDEALSSLHEL
ncbi:MAG: hypothetical protein KAS32_00790 [Candidatus Peribacteraceae bacterium]|nr:hypothetical protein [Candidatus Peribacteraceae bacterium]